MDPVEASRKGIEIWRDIPGHEGHYQVSNLGRVKSLGRVIIRSDGQRHLCKERILAPKPGKYPGVSLAKDLVKKTVAIHTLVASAFLGVPPVLSGKRIEVLHGDDDKSNNRLYNLRYGNHSQNINDAKRNGLRTFCDNGEANISSKLTISQVKSIRSAHTLGSSVKSLAEKYSVSVSNIRNIINYKTWDF